MDPRPRPRFHARRRAVALVAAPGVLAVLAVTGALASLLPRVAAWDFAWTAAALTAWAGTRLAGRAAEAEDRVRLRLWSAATACWLGGQIAWDLTVLPGLAALSHVADVGWWGFAMLMVVSFLRPAPGTAGRALRAVAVAEGVPIVAAVMALTFSLLWTNVAASALGPWDRASALLYPIVYVSAAVLTLQAMLGGSLRGASGAGTRLVLAGNVAQAAAFIAWSEILLEGSYEPGTSFVDPMWLAGLLAIGAGGVLSARAGAEPRRERESQHRAGVLPAATFLILLAALVQATVSAAPTGAQLTLAGGLLCTGGALIVRGALLQRRLRSLLAVERQARRALALREAELARLNDRLVEDSRRDALTGLRNRRALDEELPLLARRAAEGGRPYAVALLDVDRFKSYNDQLGHIAGDEALRIIAAAVERELRPGDLAFRYGGEELLLVLRDAAPRDAAARAERVRRAVRDAALAHPGGVGGVVTVSIGVAAGSEEPGALLGRADAALYAAKAAGRDRVHDAVHGPVVPDGDSPAAAGEAEEPVLRHLRGMLAVSRAAGAGGGELPVLETLAETIRTELRFRTVVVNVVDPEREELRVAHVVGDPNARSALLGTSSLLAEWMPLLGGSHDRCGAIWVPAGTHAFRDDVPVHMPDVVPVGDPAAWDADDMLLLPLRGRAGELRAIVSIDEPSDGRRPSDADLTILMAVADQAALALEQARRDGERTGPDHELRLAAVMLLAETLDLRDAGTAAHSRTVGEYARATAVQLGLAGARVERVHAAGVLHDLGKLGIADAVLHKPGALDDHEWEQMRQHPEIGARILEHAGLQDIAAWVLAHHERVDGRGYPRGLAGERIPLEARILAVADAYEAMIATRPYRAGRPAEEAEAELQRCRGSQFDAAVVDAFLAAVAGEDEPAMLPRDPFARPLGTAAR